MHNFIRREIHETFRDLCGSVILSCGQLCYVLYCAYTAHLFVDTFDCSCEMFSNRWTVVVHTASAQFFCFNKKANETPSICLKLL